VCVRVLQVGPAKGVCVCVLQVGPAKGVCVCMCVCVCSASRSCKRCVCVLQVGPAKGVCVFCKLVLQEVEHHDFRVSVEARLYAVWHVHVMMRVFCKSVL
jgi:hypothetical protein